MPMPVKTISRPSPNHDARMMGSTPYDGPIDCLVLHYTELPDAQTSIDRLSNPETALSAHYVIDDDGAIYALVEESQRAWHAGESFWRGHRNINYRSIGIEIQNDGYTPYRDAQLTALIALCHDITHRHALPAHGIVGHSDIAPRRKIDPGAHFPWALLAKNGIGLWPDDTSSPASHAPLSLRALLADLGYEMVDEEKTIAAFQRRYRPAAINGQGDEETTAMAHALLTLHQSGRS